jgi:hypothetical protein
MPHPGFAARWLLWSTLENRRERANKFLCTGPYIDPLGTRGQPSEEHGLKREVPTQKQTPNTPDAKSYPASPWRVYPGVGCVECVKLFGGLRRMR